MSNIDKRIKVKKLNTGSDIMIVPSQEKGNEGNVGKWYEQQLQQKGFKVNTKHGIDLPGLNLENKTRKRGSKAPHTIGTMTYDNIINTPWEETSIAAKIQQQNRMTYDDVFGTVINESVYDFRDPEIQRLLKESYEACRTMLREQGAPCPGTIVGGDYGMLEHKDGNTYAHRISDAGMQKLMNMAKSTFNDLFDVA